MPKQNGKRQTVGPSTPQRPRKEGISSPYFAKPVTSPYFDKTENSDKSSQSRIESSNATAVKRRSKTKSTVPKLVEDRVESVLIQSGVGSIDGQKPKRKRSKASSTPSVTGLRLVLRNTHSDRSVPMVYRILAVKPRLLQGHLFHTPWWLLIAVILLNKTTGKAATPVLYEIMQKWPTMEALSRACVPELKAILNPLGLASVRTQRLILFANMYLNDPPSQSSLRPSRVVVAKGESVQRKPAKLTRAAGEPKYPPTMVSHLPGMGRYALDSFRLFCCVLAGESDWKNVMPLDKELRVYARWRWAVIGFAWDAERGVVGPVNDRYLHDLCEGTLNPRCSAPDYILHANQA